MILCLKLREQSSGNDLAKISIKYDTPRKMKRMSAKEWAILAVVLTNVNVWFCLGIYANESPSPPQNAKGSKDTIPGQTANNNNLQTANQPGSSDDYIDDLDPNLVDCWPASRMPIRVFIHPAAGVRGYKANYLDLFKQSCQEWSKASNGKISFAFIDNPQQSDIKVTWIGDRSIFTTDETGDAQPFSNENGIGNATVRLLTLPQIDANSNDALVKTACLHEMGHVLGLTGHSRNPSDIMTEHVQLKWSDTPATVTLTQRDRNTIAHLYSDFPAIKAHWKASGKLPNGQSKDKVILNNLAATAIIANDFPTAMQRLQQVLQLDPNFRLAQGNLQVLDYNWGLKHIKEGNYEEAASLIKKSIELREKLYGSNDPKMPPEIQAYAYCLRQLHKDDEATKWEARIKKVGVH